MPIADGWRAARLGDRVMNFETTGVDLRDPITTGLFDLRTGSLPEAPGEVVVNDAMLAKGFRLGGSLEVDGTTLTIVGVGRDATARDQPKVLGSIDDLPGESTGGSREWLVDAGPVSWSNVRDVNEIGGVVTSRAVLADPPDLASMAEQMGYDTGTNEMVAVVVLIVVMALIEVVLLAGPAFAVGARRHARTLALIAASGGTPAQARRVILGSGVVLGLVASAIGLLLGIVAGWALVPLVQRFNGEWFGPFELPWTYLAAIVAFGRGVGGARVRRARLARQPPGRGRGPRRPPRRPWAAGRDAGGGPGAAGRRRCGVDVRSPHLRQRQRSLLDRRGRHRVGPRHDPGGAGAGRDDRPALGPAAADGEVRRPRRRTAPHPHRAGRGRRRRDGRRRGRAGHRQRER